MGRLDGHCRTNRDNCLSIQPLATRAAMLPSSPIGDQNRLAPIDTPRSSFAPSLGRPVQWCTWMRILPGWCGWLADLEGDGPIRIIVLSNCQRVDLCLLCTNSKARRWGCWTPMNVALDSGKNASQSCRQRQMSRIKIKDQQTQRASLRVICETSRCPDAEGTAIITGCS